MSGFFKIWRDLFDKPIWLNSTPEQKVILITLIKMANWKKSQWEWCGKPYYCKPGEFITSYNSIIMACGKGVTYQNVRTAIKKFKNYEFLTYHSTVGEWGGIKVIINNWDKYQKEINTSTNESLTDCPHITNISLTPIEEYKNDKNDKNVFFIKGEKTKKLDPYIDNHVIEKYKNEHEKYFGNKLRLDAQQRQRIMELNADIDGFIETIPEVFEKLKNITFDVPNFNPNGIWLLRDSNYANVLNGLYDKRTNKVIDEWYEKTKAELAAKGYK